MNKVINELSTICPHLASCSGCVLSDASAPPIWLDVKKYFTNCALVTGALTHWRIKSKLAVQGTFKQPRIGLFRAGTHAVEPIPQCHAHHPSINQAVQLLKQAIGEERIPIYCEQSHAGLLRYVQCVVHPPTGRVQLTLVSRGEDVALHKLAQTLLRKSDLWHSIWLNIQPSANNSILGERWIHLTGPSLIELPMQERSFLFHPASFLQAHWTLFESLAHFVTEQIPPHAHLLEIYAGVGVMGLLAAPHCRSVRLVENNPFSHASFQAMSVPPNVHYHLGDAKDAIALLPTCNCILVDPPRKGLDPILLQALQKASGTLIYVSCDFHSFRRDADALIHAGWTLCKAQGYLLFPGTNHVEIVAVFER